MRTLFVVVPFLWACGGPGAVLKSPVESKCSSAGLKGCDEMTDGVILYVEGKEDEGKDKLVHGANANTPGKVKKFAKSLKQLDKVPGTGKYMKPIMKVADILADTAKKKGGGGGAAGGPGDDDEGPEEGPIGPGPGRMPPPPPPPPPHHR